MKEKYKKENLESVIRNSKNWSEVLFLLKLSKRGNNRETLKKYVSLYNIDISHFETKEERYKRTNKILNRNKRVPLNKIFVINSTYNNTGNIKKRLFEEDLKQPICELCGQDENWQGKRMSLILDHINGVNNDNRIENLRIVCPNCNATLPTHCRGHKGLKNKKAKNITESIKKRTKLLRKAERPPYEELKKEIKKTSYSAVGRKYGVSDNAIRKWLKFYEKYEK